MLTTGLGNVEGRFAEAVAGLDRFTEVKIRFLGDGDEDSRAKKIACRGTTMCPTTISNGRNSYENFHPNSEELHMGTTTADNVRIENRFAEIVREFDAIHAKLKPIEDPNATPDPEREGAATEKDHEESESDQRDSEGDRE